MKTTGKSFAAGVAALIALGLALGTARAQDEAEGVLVIKRADGSALIRKPALTLDGSGEVFVKPDIWGMVISPNITLSLNSAPPPPNVAKEAVAGRVAEIRKLLLAGGVPADRIADTNLNGNPLLPALSIVPNSPQLIEMALTAISHTQNPLEVRITGYINNDRPSHVKALALAIADAEIRKNAFVTAARPREIVMVSMSEGDHDQQSYTRYFIQEPGKPLPADLSGFPKADVMVRVTANATLRYGWKDEIGDATALPKSAAKPTVKPAPQKTAAKRP